eukprot:TRINITY_DN4435_c0_g1_i2.p1 TRINITY_DN4435_c0_g1~~TRINITY_DN4435_c0_g1_i2.p1  ORF type:complete len:900 (-),score=186.28 TRINITY_DN4435_c0_g1_i2:100-2799(-)
MNDKYCPESTRLHEDKKRDKNWKRWGTYLPERQWGTVREDYSESGDAWNYFTHDQARSRAYRWGDDGLLGFTDRECRLCFGNAFWNGVDGILKERLFGLTNSEGNHGEDVKEAYFYLEAIPTHSYNKALYKYPQRAFPYTELIQTNQSRSKFEPEFEITDTNVFNENRYFDIEIEYLKHDANDILIQITATNRGPDPSVLHNLPNLFFRNTWSWGPLTEDSYTKPEMKQTDKHVVRTNHETFGKFLFLVDPHNTGTFHGILFTENETDMQRLFGIPSSQPFVKDAFHEYIINKRQNVVNPELVGTKCAPHYEKVLQPGEEWILRFRLVEEAISPLKGNAFGDHFTKILNDKRKESTLFYEHILPYKENTQQFLVMKQALSGLLWSKQFYNYEVKRWIEGDPGQPIPPSGRKKGRNTDWFHLFNRDVILMPDKWEYPWYACWDLAFHCVEFARMDPEFSKAQLTLFLREWYCHGNGSLPAYEFSFSDVNPPVHAWAVWRVYKITAPRGSRDTAFLESNYQKLLINFTWWTNRKDSNNRNLFAGGFLGLDNVGVFDRSKPLFAGQNLEQADGTAWMASYCLHMLVMAIELALKNPVYEDIASKFFEHFVSITNAINTLGGSGLWNDADGFFYDQISFPDGSSSPLKLRSIVGLLPMMAVSIITGETMAKLPNFKKRVDWFLKHRPEMSSHILQINQLEEYDASKNHNTWMLAIPTRMQLVKLLKYMLDENEFLSDYGIRSLSKHYEKYPFIFNYNGEDLQVNYDPADSTSGLFGGNSNWRGPIWFPLNFLLVEALERYHHFYGDNLLVECPTGSGNKMNLAQVSNEIKRRLSSIFLPDKNGVRPYAISLGKFAKDPFWSDNLLFNEYFDGNNGRGLGSLHQTGWTSLVVDCLRSLADDQNK